jgi:anti-sigma regulatory factor (Ser/Thr protein kinase)
MPDDHGSPPVPLLLHDWADTLPAFASTVVAGADTAQPHIYTQTAALPDQVRGLRRQVTGWTEQLGFSDVTGQDIVLAADEAVSNAIEHAYPDSGGTLTLFAAPTRQADSVRIIVSDHGLWRPPPADPGFRGRGLAMMQQLAGLFRLMHSPYGTTVVLGWPLPR